MGEGDGWSVSKCVHGERESLNKIAFAFGTQYQSKKGFDEFE